MDTDEVDQDSEMASSESIGGLSTIGTASRAVVALSGVILGLIWIMRITIDGAQASGVLFRLLPPLVLIYLGIRYFQSVVTTNP